MRTTTKKNTTGNTDKSFVSYKEISLVNLSVDPLTNNEKFVILPFSGVGVVGRHSGNLAKDEGLANIIVREGVFARLKRADEALKAHHPSWQLVVVYGYRTPETQQQLYDLEYRALADEYTKSGRADEVGGEDFIERVHLKVAVPTVAGHPTGGAVDVTVFDSGLGQEIDFGAKVGDCRNDTAFGAKVGSEARRNRDILRKVMVGEGFAPYDGDFWHFSYGDREWVVYRKRLGEAVTRPLYAPIARSQVEYLDKNKRIEKFEADGKLVLAMQKGGRLTDETLGLLNKSGISITLSKEKLYAKSNDFPLEILLVRDDDIPELVASGIADIGIVGENVFVEKQLEAVSYGNSFRCKTIKRLGFGKCSLWVAVPNDGGYTSVEELDGKTVATSYPYTSRKFFEDLGVKNVTVKKFFGSVEITPSIGFSDAIVDLVSTGNSLRQNRLVELQKITDSESMLVANSSLSETKERLLREFLVRFESGVAASKSISIAISVAKSDGDAVKSRVTNAGTRQVMVSESGGIVTISGIAAKNKVWGIVAGVSELVGDGYKEVSFGELVGVVGG